VEMLADRWGCSGTEVHRRLVEAAGHAEALKVIERVTWPKVLPDAKRYRVAAERTANVQVEMARANYGASTLALPTVFKAGQVLSRDGFPPGYIERLHAAGVQLEPLPD